MVIVEKPGFYFSGRETILNVETRFLSSEKWVG